MSDLSCSFRRGVHQDGSSESAVCGFIQQLTQLDEQFCRVDRSACEVCVQHSPFAPAQMNPVMPSLMLSACSLAADECRPGSTAATLRSWAESVVETQSVPCLVPTVVSCDVVLCVSDVAADITAAVESIFAQDHLFPVLHLVADGTAAAEGVARFAQRSGVRVHRFEETQGLWKCIHRLMPSFRTPWIAIQTATSISRPERLKTAIEQLQDDTGDIFGSATSDGVTIFPSRLPSDARYSPSIELSTLVMRRAAFAELGGFDLRRGDPGEEFFHRAFCEGRNFCISDQCLTTGSQSLSSQLSEAPGYLQEAQDRRLKFEEQPPSVEVSSSKLRSTWKPLRLKQLASGFPERSQVSCDVVLPFRDDFHFVREAMQGLLSQEDAEITIHLVDDASRESVAELFAEYRDLSNVRLYQNEQNLGPFATFNNVSEFSETPFIAVQDADDISLPSRISTQVRLLQNSGADIAASATELFGQPELVPLVAHVVRTTEDGEREFVRESRYPCRRGRGYFLENPTLTMRLDSFRRLGGYADYGESRRSRTGVDTEFQQRAYFAHAHIAVTRDILLKYRCHGKSATNDDASGFGSQAQRESQTETRRRFLHYATGSFDPRYFGALGQHFGITRPL